ncbi:uncharacterized protein J8A68_003648 [[Candida] subhashii]|uniref:Uncharacterized protein n=1 Tax=[Candida] subhashii TaxID=561895 RepID=A0A8J5UY29_9ASCO|nr:uncharacterized protein J8A68_003648 [[Candida] subhashii]KAG7662794.1 hypothetical protein J8A68_003648 [[Candida] subhashii]
MTFSIKRKHREVFRDEDDEVTDSSGKKIKLDSIFQNLSISESKSSKQPEEKKNTCFVINPGITTKYGGIHKRVPSGSTIPRSLSINSFLNERLNEHLNELLIKSLSLVHWYDYRFLVIYWYQKWFIKLFNRFVRKYNERNGTSIPRFKTYDKILQLVNDNMLSSVDLFNIISQENELEIHRLRVKQEKRELRKGAEDSKSEQEIYGNIKYDYWDTIHFDPDLEMLDRPAPTPKVVELKEDHESDLAMDLDDDDVDMGDSNVYYQSNYGSYYTDYGAGGMTS